MSLVPSTWKKQAWLTKAWKLCQRTEGLQTDQGKILYVIWRHGYRQIYRSRHSTCKIIRRATTGWQQLTTIFQTWLQQRSGWKSDEVWYYRSEWNNNITEKLSEGALQFLERHGVKEENILVRRVPEVLNWPSGPKTAGRKSNNRECCHQYWVVWSKEK